jgi:hypothetical protein
MITLLFSMFLHWSAAPVSQCETLGPRVDGIRVTVCDGHVRSMTDASGYTLAYPWGAK